MGERPILFSGPMVRAILDGRKTQTRRVLKGIEDLGDGRFHLFNAHGGCFGVAEADIPTEALNYPAYEVGDRLWVRETWTHTGDGVWTIANARMALNGRVSYRADGEIAGAKYWPSIHMPREFSRITLEVTGVKVERLQDISESDAEAEGCAGGYNDDASGYRPAVGDFADLWNSINGPGAWEANPWVVAISFRVSPAPTTSHEGA